MNDWKPGRNCPKCGNHVTVYAAKVDTAVCDTCKAVWLFYENKEWRELVGAAVIEDRIIYDK